MDSQSNEIFSQHVAVCELAVVASVKHGKDTTHKQMVSLQYEFACVLLVSIYWGNTFHNLDIEISPYPYLWTFPADPSSVMAMDPGIVMSPYKPLHLKALLVPYKNVSQDDIG